MPKLSDSYGKGKLNKNWGSNSFPPPESDDKQKRSEDSYSEDTDDPKAICQTEDPEEAAPLFYTEDEIKDKAGKVIGEIDRELNKTVDSVKKSLQSVGGKAKDSVNSVKDKTKSVFAAAASVCPIKEEQQNEGPVEKNELISIGSDESEAIDNNLSPKKTVGKKVYIIIAAAVTAVVLIVVGTFIFLKIKKDNTAKDSQTEITTELESVTVTETISEETDLSAVIELKSFDFYKDIGKSLKTLQTENPDMVIDPYPNEGVGGQAQMYGESNGDFAYYFYTANGIPFIKDIINDGYAEKLNCIGIYSTVGVLFSGITDTTATEDFFRSINVNDYACSSFYGTGSIGFEYNGFYFEIRYNSESNSYEYTENSPPKYIKSSYSVYILDMSIDNSTVFSDWYDDYIIREQESETDNYIYIPPEETEYTLPDPETEYIPEITEPVSTGPTPEEEFLSKLPKAPIELKIKSLHNSEEYARIQITDIKLESNMKLTVNIKNMSEKAISYLSLKLVIYDADGVRIDQRIFSVSDIRQGETVEGNCYIYGEIKKANKAVFDSEISSVSFK